MTTSETTESSRPTADVSGSSRETSAWVASTVMYAARAKKVAETT
jgi:hypothetical protein